MKQDDDINVDDLRNDLSDLMPIQVGLHTPPRPSIPPQCHPIWTGQKMEKLPTDGTQSSSFPSSAGQGYGFKTERPDTIATNSSRSPQQNAFQFPQGFNPAPAFPSGMPPLALANGVPGLRFPDSLPSLMFPGGGMPNLAVGNDAVIWRMMMDTYSRMTNHRNDLMQSHMNHRLQMQNSVEHPMQFAPMDQRQVAYRTPSKLQDHQQQSIPNYPSMEMTFRHQGLGYSSPQPNNTLDLSTSKKMSARARKMGKKSPQIFQPGDPQNLVKNFSSETSLTHHHHPLAFSPPYSPFVFPNSVSAPPFGTTSNPSPLSSISIKSEPVLLDDTSKSSNPLPQTNKERFAQLEIKSPNLQSRELPIPVDHPRDFAVSYNISDPTEMGSGCAESDLRQDKSSEPPRESLSGITAQRTSPEVSLKEEILASEEQLLYASGGSGGVDVDVLDVRSGSPSLNRRQLSPPPADGNRNGCLDSTGSGRGLGFSLSGAPSLQAATSVRRKKILRCRRCSFATTEKEAFYKHKYEHFPPERLMVCSECSFVTQLKHHFQYHINTHKGVRPYPCSMCDYRGTNLAMLKSHLKTHKKYSCADCGYSAASTDILQLHMNAENHKAAPVLSAMRIRNRVLGLGNKRRNASSRLPGGGLKMRKRFAFGGSQADSAALLMTESTGGFAATPLNAYHLGQSFGVSQLGPRNHPGGVDGSSGGWPGAFNSWPAAVPSAVTPGQLAPSFALPQPLPFGGKSSDENLLFTCEFCSFGAVNQNHLMHHVTSEHRQLLNMVLQSSKLPLDGSSGSGLVPHKGKSTPPRTGDASALLSPSVHSGSNSLPRFSGNGRAPDNRSADTSVVAIENINSNVSQGQTNPGLPLNLSCTQEPCQKPSRRKGVARKLAVEQIEDEDVTEYFSNFLPTPEEFSGQSGVSGVAQQISDSREHSDMRSDRKMETESEELILESQNLAQDPLQEAPKSSAQRLLSKPGDKPSIIISGKNCNERSVPPPPGLRATQESGERRENRSVDAAKRIATAEKTSPAKTYKCHHCGIIFLDYILYSMHNGYHNFDDPLRCNICGRRSNDILEFYTHIGKYAHPES